MSRFDEIVSNNLRVLEEADMGAAPAPAAPAPAGGAPAAPMGGGASALPGAGGEAPGMGGGLPGGEEKMDDDAKKETDPIQFTKSVLEMVTKVTPEMFDSYLNTFSGNFAKIKDKEQFKHYYRSFYSKLKYIFDIQGELSDLFKQLQGDAKQLLGGEEQNPNTAGGGTGQAGPSGPGVK
jgi:hypothetical protein